jgi:hypothetical protein
VLPNGVVWAMRPSPLVMLCVYAFGIALLLFSAALVARTQQPTWLWALNAVAFASGLGGFGYWLVAAFNGDRDRANRAA